MFVNFSGERFVEDGVDGFLHGPGPELLLKGWPDLETGLLLVPDEPLGHLPAMRGDDQLSKTVSRKKNSAFRVGTLRIRLTWIK